MAAQKTAAQLIEAAVKRGPKKGLSAITLAERTGLALNTVRFTLTNLVAEGAISIVGSVETGLRGRPGNLYGV